MDWKIRVLGFYSREGLGIFVYTIVSSRSPPSLLSSGYQRLFLWG